MMMTMSILWEIGFMRPVRLWALLALPVLAVVYLVLIWLKRSKTRRQATNLDILFPRRSAWKRHVAVGAAILSLGSLTLAWAQPNGYVQVPRDRATIFLVIDVSRSMEATDVAPNRLQAAKDAATDFVNNLPKGFNASLVAFSGTASLLVPPTEDRGKITTAIAGLRVGPSTAIGEGIFTALDAISLIPPDPAFPDDPPGVAMVVLSDGASNLGRSSTAAAKQAKADGVAVSTIAFGTKDGYIPGPYGSRQSVPVEAGELKNIADASGGKAYSAGSLGQLREVYDNIAQTVGYEMQETEITARFVGFAVGFGLIAVLGAMSLAARWP